MTWWSSDWDYRKKITIHKSTYSTTETQTDFPFLIKHTDADIKAHAQSSGSDICFADESGSTQLDHEIELWDDSSGSLISWVRIPSLPSDEDLDIYVYYGNPASGNQENVAGTWDSNFKGVYHKSDLTTSTIKDSTSNRYDGTKKGANEPVETTGIVNKAQNYDGSNDYIAVDLDVTRGANTGTVSVWHKTTTNISQVFYSVSNSGTDYYYLMFCVSSAEQIILMGPTRGLTNTIILRYNMGSSYYDGTWHNYVITSDASNENKLYVNGERKAWDIATGNTTLWFSNVTNNPNCSTMGLLRRPSPFAPLNGDMDEVRFSNIPRSADWIKTEYNSINYGYDTSIVSDGFFTFGAEEEGVSEPIEPTQVLLEDGVSLTDSVFYKHLISLTDDVSIATDLVTIKDIIHYQAESQVSIFDSYDLSHAYNVYENPALTDLLYAKHLIIFDDTIDVLDVFYAKHLITYLDTVPVQDVGWKLNYIQSEIFNIASKIYVNAVRQERFGAQFTIKGVAYNLKLPVPLWNSADSSLNNNVEVLNLWSKDIRALDTGLGDEQTVLLGIWEISNPAEFSENMELLFTLQDESAPITIDDLSDTLDGVYILAQISITTIPKVTGAYQYKIVLQKVRNIYE